MNTLYLIIFFILGLFMGSFYTVLGLRLPNKEKVLFDRSHCDKCKHELSLLDMIPILSYFFLKGRCRYCKSKISGLSSYMEFFTGIFFALSYHVFGPSYELFIALGIVSMLIIISVSDITYLIIPDEILIFFTGYFLIITALQSGMMGVIFSIFYGLVLFTTMYLIMLLGNLLFKKETLGGGDIKMMFVIGLVLHPLLGIFVIFLSSFIALPLSILILVKKGKNLLPFGPFLLISFTLVYFTKIDINKVLDFIKGL